MSVISICLVLLPSKDALKYIRNSCQFRKRLLYVIISEHIYTCDLYHPIMRKVSSALLCTLRNQSRLDSFQTVRTLYGTLHILNISTSFFSTLFIQLFLTCRIPVLHFFCFVRLNKKKFKKISGA